MAGKTAAAWAVLAISLLWFARSAAQHTVPPLEELTVTARKQAEPLQKVPVSVVPLDGEALQRNGVATLAELSAYVPNVQIGESAFGSQLFIRGIGSGPNFGYEQSVGTFIDGVYYGRDRSARNPLFDVERVEILRGAQGTLFGKNTIAGAVVVSGAMPTAQWQNSLMALYADQQLQRVVGGVLSGPLSDTTGVRLAVRAADGDGWLDNTARHRSEPQDNEHAARLGLRWRPADDMDVYGKIESSRYTTKGRASQITICSTSLQLVMTANALNDDCAFNSTKNSLGNIVTGAGGGSVDFGREQSTTRADNANVTINWQTDAVTVTSITAYQQHEFEDLHDADFSALTLLAADIREDYSQESQEVRVATRGQKDFDYTIGVYWQHTDLQTDGTLHLSDLQLPGGISGGRLPLGPVNGSRLTHTLQQSDSYAAFAQGSWHFTPRWDLIGGLRYTHEQKDITREQLFAELAATTATASAGVNAAFRALGFAPYDITDKRQESNISPAITLLWHSDVTMLYLSAKRGFKGGGFDFSLPTGDAGNFQYDEEEVTTTEVGVRTTLAGGSGELNVTLFRSDFDDVQVSSFNGVLGLLVTNAGKTRSEGIEIDSRWQLSTHWSMRALAAWLDAGYKVFPDAQCYAGQSAAAGCINGAQNLAGKPVQFAPDWQANLQLVWHTQASGKWQWSTTLDYQYTGDYTIANDLDPNLLQNAFSKINLRVALNSSDDKITFALIGRNLTDSQSSGWGNDVPLFSGSYMRQRDPPRSVALQAGYRF